MAAVEQGSLREVLIIVAALSLQDPRERPADKQQQADQAHARWRNKESDFMSLLNVWDHMEEQRQQLSGNQLGKYCKANFISYLRMREWRDLHHQLHHSVRDLKLKTSSALLPEDKLPEHKSPKDKLPDNDNSCRYDYGAVHRALLTGLLGQVANLHEGREYMGTRNRKFMIFPGSGVFSNKGRKTPKWLMCAELLETSKLYAHNVAKIDQQWLPSLAAHLVKKNYSEPHYDARRGEVMAFEKQTLYGLTIVERQHCRYSHIDPVVSRQVFIQRALVEGHYADNKRGKGAFFKHNQALLNELEQLEARVRRRDIVVEESVIYQFFDERLPADIVNLVAFEQWRKKAEQGNPQLLCMGRELLVQRALNDSIEAQFPDHIQWQGVQYSLHYHFEPGHEQDGVTATIPLAALHQVPKYRFEWLVPGMLRDKCISLVKSLPKPLRRHFVPVPNAVDKALPELQPDNRPLSDALAEQLQRHFAIDLSSAPWQQARLDDYYRMNFRLLDESGQQLAMARDLEQLQSRYRGEVQSSIQQAADPAFEQQGLQQWNFGELPELYEAKSGGLTVRAWPALLDEGDSVSLKLMDHPEAARNLSWQGVLRLALLQHSQPVKYLRKQLLKGTDLKLMAAALPKREQLLEPLVAAAYRQALFSGQSLPRNQSEFEALLALGSGDIVGCANELEALLLSLLEPLAVIRKAIKKLGLAAIHGAGDINTQLDQLLAEGFLLNKPVTLLRQYPRYIKAIVQRLDKIAINTLKDRQYTLELQALEERLQSLPSEQDEWTEGQKEAVNHYQYMLQEYRVSLFAQQLKTALPVSAKRIDGQWALVREQFA